MKRLLPLLCLSTLASAWGGDAPGTHEADLRTAIASHLSAHPRLLWTAAEQTALGERVARDPALQRVEAHLRAEGERLLQGPPLTRTLEGNRLLGVAQQATRRLLLHAYLWRRTGDRRYLDHVRGDVAAVLAFSDWNPGHFLDVAVLAHGVAVAYDWCHGDLSGEERSAIRQGLLTKAIAPSRRGQWWVNAGHNWNQVCHGGLGLAALAIAEDNPDEAAWVLGRAVDNLPTVMRTYGPDGAYAEGPSYWAFGTTYNVLLLDSLRSAVGRDFNLDATPGFLATGSYFLHATGSSGEYFMYSDCLPRTGPVPVAAWFAARCNDPSLAWNEWRWMDRLGSAGTVNAGSVWNPDLTMLMIWGARLPDGGATPAATHWSGRGTTPTAYHRSGWGADDTWVALKGGTPKANHGHMDVGAFAMDALGVRWADDLGMQEYLTLERAGITLWQMGAESSRWKVFRLGASSHSLITVDGRPQRLEGSAAMIVHRPDRSVVDLSATYAGQLASAARGVALLPDRSVVVEDDLTAGTAPATVRWAMLTRAEVQVQGNGATLTRDGRTLALRVLDPPQATVTVFSTDPPAPYDAANPGTRLVGFTVPLTAGSSATLRVALVPGGGPTSDRLPATGVRGW